jgi:hypothetical protein
MTEKPQHDRPEEPSAALPDDAVSLDMLIGRIIDGEATLAQRERFETMASSDPGLWRTLALRQQDMSMLAAHVEPRLNAAEMIDLPQTQPRATPLRLPWWISVSGWAALVALAVTWGYSAQRDRAHVANLVGQQAAQPAIRALSPEEHLREYLHAPYVLNEMPPVFLDKEQLKDGRIAVSFLRRIVEVRYVDSPDDIPVDAEGAMIGVPTRLSKEPPPAFSPQD